MVKNWIREIVKEVLKIELWDIKRSLENGHILSVPIVCCDGCGVITTEATCYKKEVRMTAPSFVMIKRYCQRCNKDPLRPFDKELLEK